MSRHQECSILNSFYREREAVKVDNPYLAFLASMDPDVEEKMLDKARRKEKKITKKEVDNGANEQRGKSSSSASLYGLAMDEATRPSRTEIATNSRSRSAILHCIRKTDRITIRSCEKEVYKLMR